MIDEGEGVDGTPNDVLLDRKVPNGSCTISHNSTTGVSTVTVPYTEAATKQLVLSDGSIPTISSQTSTQLLIEQDLSSATFDVGVPFTFEYHFSTQYLREGEQGAQVAIQDGRLELRYFSLLFMNSANFTVEVSPVNKDTNVYRFTGRVLGSGSNTLDATGYDTGEFRFPIYSKNDQVDIKIKNDSPFTSSFSSTEWEAFYYPKTKRV